ncbi:hypothetical protein EDD85DRAFT_956908 [Armillaria nabsnona]|nr:hypothetical protein EDD85DRAFT_956908 [Armillaria nabsnona]
MPSTNNTASKKIKQVQSEKRSAEEMAVPLPRSKCVKIAGGEPKIDDISDKILSEDDNLMNNTSALSDGMAQPLNKLSVANDPVNDGDEWVDITPDNIAHNVPANGPTAFTLSDKENKPPGTNDVTIVAVPTSGTTPVTEGPAITDNVAQSVLANGTPTVTLSDKENKPPGTDASAVGTQGSSQIVAPQVPFPFFKQLLAGVKAIPVLPRMKELGVSYGDPDPCVITPFILADQFAGNKEKAKCLLNFAFNAEGHNMQNLFSALTRQYKYLVVNPKNDGRKIVYAKDNKDATFFVIRKVTFCNLASGEYNKEIDIQPMGIRDSTEPS